MLATEFAVYHKVDPQGTEESDEDFKLRVSNTLHQQGAIVEAHEVLHDQLYSEGGVFNDTVMGSIQDEIKMLLLGLPRK